jgi:hypothetical protein
MFPGKEERDPSSDLPSNGHLCTNTTVDIEKHSPERVIKRGLAFAPVGRYTAEIGKKHVMQAVLGIKSESLFSSLAKTLIASPLLIQNDLVLGFNNRSILILTVVAFKLPIGRLFVKMTVAEEMEVEGQGLTQTFKDLFSGACGGIAQVLIGMNFLVLFPCVILFSYGRILPSHV